MVASQLTDAVHRARVHDRSGAEARRPGPDLVPMSVKTAVVYYSATGSVHAMAEAVVEGAEKAGAEVRLRRAPELAGEDAIDFDTAWRLASWLPPGQEPVSPPWPTAAHAAAGTTSDVRGPGARQLGRRVDWHTPTPACESRTQEPPRHDRGRWGGVVSQRRRPALGGRPGRPAARALPTARAGPGPPRQRRARPAPPGRRG